MEEKNEDIDLELDDYEDDQDTQKDWKAEALKAQGIAKRYKTKYEKEKETKKAEEKEDKKETKETSLDYGQKAYLIANGIKGADEIKFTTDFMAKTGKTLDEVLESKYFHQELKDMRDDKEAKAATPSSSKRSGSQAKTEVEYWIAKGELPPADQVELRRAVVNAKIKSETTLNPFSKNPVVR